MQSDILAVGAHPDDVDFSIGGLLAKLAKDGYTITSLDFSLGEKGTNGTCEERKRESINAAKIIGAKKIFLDFVDCEIFDTYENRLKIVEVIRNVKPKLVLAPYWKGSMGHPDHVACGQMCRYGVRYARFKNILPKLDPHRPKGILHYLFPSQQKPNFLVDVTEHVDTWKKMIESHTTQLKTNDYLGWNLRAAEHWGDMIGTKYAQGLIASNPIVVDDLMHVSQGTLEI